ncbi:MAG: hypothetical protein WCY12_04115, partial [Candidatus Omnitrophota bacterium]
MAKRLLFASLMVLLLFGFSFAEDLTITTYYPSPNGSYRELRAQRMAIGENFYGTDYCWPDGSCTNVMSTETDLAIEGRVAIGGTTQPLGLLDVAGGAGTAGAAVFAHSAPGTPGTNTAHQGEAIRIRKWESYNNPATGTSWGSDRQALIIEATDDDNYVEGGMILGFGLSNALGVSPLASGWATSFRPAITIRGEYYGSPRVHDFKVGIGNDNPTYAKLIIRENRGNYLAFENADTNDGWIFNHRRTTVVCPGCFDLGYIADITAQSTSTTYGRFVVSPSGNVGIGDSNPSRAKLTVVGDLVVGNESAAITPNNWFSDNQNGIVLGGVYRTTWPLANMGYGTAINHPNDWEGTATRTDAVAAPGTNCIAFVASFVSTYRYNSAVCTYNNATGVLTTTCGQTSCRCAF